MEKIKLINLVSVLVLLLGATVGFTRYYERLTYQSQANQLSSEAHSLDKPLPPPPSTDPKLHVVVSLSIQATTHRRVFVNGSLHAVVSSQPQSFSLSSQALTLNQPLPQPPSTDPKLHVVISLLVHASTHPHLFVNRSLHAVVSRQPESFSLEVTLSSPPGLEMGPMVAEARTCESQSHRFKGLCLIRSNCATVCQTAEGFHGGKCQGLRLQCVCTKHC